MAKTGQYIAEERACGLEIEPVQRIVVEESPIDGCGSFEQGRGVAAVECLEIGGERVRRFKARFGRRPSPHQAAQYCRAVTSPYRVLEKGRIDIFPFLRFLWFDTHIRVPAVKQ